MMNQRQLGATALTVSPVAMGGWPISGMTSLGVTRDDSIQTIRAAFDSGINFFDTAYAYGRDGESERMIGETLGTHRHEIVIATKGGLAWGPDGERILDGSAPTLRRQCETSLKRLGTDYVDLLYLHAPDPHRSIEESAEALRRIQQEGKATAIGVSNVTLEQLNRFHDVCKVAAVQPAYNMLMREIERDVIPWCQRHDVAVCPYWPLMKGLLAGKLHRDHQFEPGDGRAKYPMFQGDEWQRNQDFVDRLREIANSVGWTVAQLVVNWTIGQPGITAALCGAKRADQITETAMAMQRPLDRDTANAIQQALDERGPAQTKPAV